MSLRVISCQGDCGFIIFVCLKWLDGERSRRIYNNTVPVFLLSTFDSYKHSPGATSALLVNPQFHLNIKYKNIEQLNICFVFFS